MKFYCKKNLLQEYTQIYLQTLNDFLKIDKSVGSVSMGGWFMWDIAFCQVCSEKLFCRFLTVMALSQILFLVAKHGYCCQWLDYLFKKPFDQSEFKRNLG